MTKPKPISPKTASGDSDNSQGRVPLEQVWKKGTLYKAIRLKCLDCCAGQLSLVATCAIKSCALWPYRFGAASRRKTKEVTP